MEAAFAWIGQLVTWFAMFFPHRLHVLATHKAVLFKKSTAKVLEPGIHWYLPLWSEPNPYPVVRQSLNLPPQYLMTSDGKVVASNVVVIFRIKDIHKALVDTYEFEDAIRDTAQGAAKRVVTQVSFAQLSTSAEKIDNELEKKIRVATKSFGVEVLDAFLTDCAPTRVLRLVGDNGALNKQQSGYEE